MGDIAVDLAHQDPRFEAKYEGPPADRRRASRRKHPDFAEMPADALTRQPSDTQPVTEDEALDWMRRWSASHGKEVPEELPSWLNPLNVMVVRVPPQLQALFNARCEIEGMHPAARLELLMYEFIRQQVEPDRANVRERYETYWDDTVEEARKGLRKSRSGRDG
ncbi:hypothetical protein [Catellatospora chokoriensis]|uniref:Uncharacterized protein n=1 Tax=Catellatospora chokoriensis TaxID=310353 RepID=A0A8J3JZD9_9ACTN|nr:hypothetical protein [Catellatospora chokoriensis]GIF89828.1 hypothetical protein Cch02nite_32720 [Catellatospora chokoriensis]